MNDKILRMDDIPEKLLNIGVKKYFKKGDVIIDQGDILTHLYILVKGKILVYVNTDKGSIYYDLLLVAPCILGEAFVIRQKEITASFKCLENTEIIMIPKVTLLNILRTDFDINMYIYNITAEKFDIWSEHSEEYATLSSEKRIILFLIELTEVLGIENDGKIKIDLNISQRFISNFTSTKRTSTVNTLDKLKNQDILEYHDGYYYIKKFDSLKHMM